MRAITLHQDPPPLLVGERVNSQGSRKVKRLLLENDYDGILDVAREQAESGAHVLDVCVALTERADEADQMSKVVKLLSMSVESPLMIDSTEASVIEAALEHLDVGVAERIIVTVLFEELAKEVVFVIANGLIEREWLAAHLDNAAGVFDRHFRALGHFLRIRLASEFLDELGRDGSDAAHRVDHVDRQADRTALIGDGAGDSLANPPRGVGGEFVAALVFELVDGTHETRVAFLD